ncbi:phage tail protein [Flavobacterium luteolum]|uniref:phage tail protein n=1 Tax=Flavobacterium luteolum TaxID=3003259 RepID=UPI00248EF221|nr:tail fiber protein [Flavobacterium luteolum]
MKKKYLLLIILVLLAKSTFAQIPFVGEIRLFPGQIVPKGWMKCEGQTLSINSNQALFSILGVIYGGNGTTTFMLPDLRNKMAIGVDQTNTTLGQLKDGNNTIKTANLPAHVHSVTIKASSATANSKAPSSAVSLAAPFQNFNNSNRNINYYNSSSANVTLPATSLSISNSGAGNPVQLQPCLSGNYCIALQGVYPPRN